MTDRANPPTRFAQTRTARLARARLARHLHGLGDDEGLWLRVQERVPEAWATVEEDLDCAEDKVKVTLRLDASVARLFRAMGKGYQARINHILATYAQMRMGEVARQARDLGARMAEYGGVWRRPVRGGAPDLPVAARHGGPLRPRDKGDDGRGLWGEGEVRGLVGGHAGPVAVPLGWRLCGTERTSRRPGTRRSRRASACPSRRAGAHLRSPRIAYGSAEDTTRQRAVCENILGIRIGTS